MTTEFFPVVVLDRLNGNVASGEIRAIVHPSDSDSPARPTASVCWSARVLAPSPSTTSSSPGFPSGRCVSHDAASAPSCSPQLFSGTDRARRPHRYVAVNA